MPLWLFKRRLTLCQTAQENKQACNLQIHKITLDTTLEAEESLEHCLCYYPALATKRASVWRVFPYKLLDYESQLSYRKFYYFIRLAW